MKRFCIFLTILLMTAPCFTYNQTLLPNLQIEYITHRNNTYGSTIQTAFKTFQTLSKHSTPSALLQNRSIVNLFLLTPQHTKDSIFNQYLQTIQQIMLIYLYDKIFNNYITQTEQLIEELIGALDYWKQEMFYEQLPILKKHPIYWYHSPHHKKLVHLHVQSLEQGIKNATTMLGMALHGKYELNKIQHDSDIFTQFIKAEEPLLQYFHIVQFQQNLEQSTMLQNTIFINESMTQQLQNYHTLLKIHKKPHHIIQHGFLYSCIAITMIASYATYQIHKDKIPEYKQKSIEAWNYFLKEYIQIPAADLKDALWEQKNNQFVLFKKPKSLTIDNSWKTWIIDDRLNHVSAWLNDIVNNLFDGGNENLEMINKASRQQQLTLACAAISPVIIGAYITYRFSNHAYNKYIKHESWHKPMQRIIREIDKILNQLTTSQEVSYAHDGMLHVLTLRLKTFISCLPNEELQLIEEDLQELSDYQISYEQKHGVLKRMYQTYSFLN